jgi:predicted aspartyl protease
MIDAKDYVAVEHVDVLLTDLKAEDIAGITIENVHHLSPATNETPDLRGTTFGENARILVKAIVSRSSRQSLEFTSLNVIMLVDTGSPYVYLSERTWEALGVKVEDLPNNGQAYVKVNGMRVLAHVSSNHFEDIDVLGSSFLKNCVMVVDYPEQTVEIHVMT